ncbi:MAG: hypothetical protein ACUVV6_07055 [Thermoplasmatota archaeon]
MPETITRGRLPMETGGARPALVRTGRNIMGGAHTLPGRRLTVRDRVGRFRYIGFVVEGGGGVGREELRAAIAEAARALPLSSASVQLTALAGDRGILRVPHVLKDDFIRLLPRVTRAGAAGRSLGLTPVVTSGTILKVKRALIIPDRRPLPRRRRRTGGPAADRGPQKLYARNRFSL